jgi:hypothetical protein
MVDNLPKLSSHKSHYSRRTLWGLRGDNENLKGVFYSIDQDPTPTNVTSVTLKGSAVKVAVTSLNGTFDGTLSGDGNTISGKWSRGGPSLPLNPVRATEETPRPLLGFSARQCRGDWQSPQW